MSKQDDQKNPPAPTPADRPFDPGHVMTRRHYEELARQAANQK